MNDQSGTAQLRFLEETAIRLRQNGFTVEPIEDHHLPVCWEKGRLCRVSGRGSVLYRQENMDSIRTQNALQSVIDTAKMTSEYMAILETAPRLKAGGLTGDYRVLADFGDAVLAGHPTERGVQFVTWSGTTTERASITDIIFRTTMKPPNATSPCAAALFKKTPFLSQSSLQRSTTHCRSSVNRTKLFPSDGIRNWRSSWNRSADCCPRMCRGSGMRRNRAA